MNVLQGISALEGIFTIAAIIGASLWAYFHYTKGRTYSTRLQLSVTGERLRRLNSDYLVVRSQLRNLGSGRIPLDCKRCGLLLHSYQMPSDVPADILVPSQIDYERESAYPVFKSHTYLEPDEIIEDQLLILAPVEVNIPLRLELHIVANKTAWSTSHIVIE